MKFTELNASGYQHNAAFYQSEFEDILRGIIVCYDEIYASGIQLPNDENKIRDVMLNNYLKKEDFKRKNSNLSDYHFDMETIENEGRADIRILPVNPYIEDEAYYIIECKRIDSKNLIGNSGLNAEYIKNGICRFTSEYYSSYFRINGMIGFVVEKLDIGQNVLNINSILNKDFINDRNIKVNAHVLKKITPVSLSSGFKYSYTSEHQASKHGTISLYHLMFNFSNNIQ